MQFRLPGQGAENTGCCPCAASDILRACRTRMEISSILQLLLLLQTFQEMIRCLSPPSACWPGNPAILSSWYIASPGRTSVCCRAAEQPGENIARALKNSIIRGQLAHAYLFCGPREVRKTSAARIFAKTINCSNPGPA